MLVIESTQYSIAWNVRNAVPTISNLTNKHLHKKLDVLDTNSGKYWALELLFASEYCKKFYFDDVRAWTIRLSNAKIT